MTNEELVLLYQHANDKKDYMEQLYNQNKNYIAFIANRYKGYVDFEDLMQEGFFGLIKAAESWDASRGVLFSTHAFTQIHAHIHRYIEDNGNIIRIPVHQFSNIVKMKRVITEYQQERGHAPKEKELAKMLGLTESQTKTLISDALCLDIRSSNEVISSEDNSLTLEDTFEDPENIIEAVEEDLQLDQLKTVLWGIVNELPNPIQSRILHERYEGNLTFEELSAKLNLSKGIIRNEECKAMRELRRAHNRKKLRPYLPEDKIYSISINYSSYGFFKSTWTSAPEQAVLMADK